MNKIEIDLPKMMETQAAHQVVCDSCSAKIGNRYPKDRKNVSVSLYDGEDEYGYAKHNEYHYCSESCLSTHLASRSKK